MSVMIVTSLGDIVVDLLADKCPLTCKNFLKLCKIKYYNGCLFHTVQKDFTAQTGDPTGTGKGGDSIYKYLYGDQARFFGDEIRLDLKHSKMGTIAMASAGEGLNASQFYITLRDGLDYLDGKHTIFGEMAEGLETLERINEAYVDNNGRPYKNIRIKHTYILDDPFDDPPQLAELIPDASPEGKPKDEVDDDVRLEDDWEPMDEQLDRSELEEILREKEAHSRAVVLESMGDIPDAEIKPPDNVLFVCKLNPVTEDEDLHTIFSRFGTVTSADIIRDYKTGDSLCYAFIEFENKEASEQAYFKMDNALIDDRRIHVDFSQSVAKLWSQYRRKDKNKGGGCFKCGSLDHFAKDCTGAPTGITLPRNYVLKDNNPQHGGDANSRYEMVFDGGATGGVSEKKRQSDPDDDYHVEKYKSKRQISGDQRDRDERRRDFHNSHRHSNRHKERQGDEKYRSGQMSPPRGREGEYRKREDQASRRTLDSGRHKNVKDEGFHKRSADDARRKGDDEKNCKDSDFDRRDDDRVQLKENMDKSKRDRSREDDYSKDRGQGRDHAKRSSKYDDSRNNRDVRNEFGNRDRPYYRRH